MFNNSLGRESMRPGLAWRRTPFLQPSIGGRGSMGRGTSAHPA
jgi:hypothetical protein